MNLNKAKLALSILILFVLVVSGYFRFEILMVLSRFESHLGQKVQAVSTQQCQPTIAKHRVSDLSQIDQTVAQNWQGVEVDLVINHEGVFVSHETGKSFKPDLTLSEFLDRFSENFETIIFDIKSTHKNDDLALSQLKNLKWPPKSIMFIGRRCRLLQRIQAELNFSAGCEAFGVLASRLFGFDLWSARYTAVTSWQIDSLKNSTLKTLFWTFRDAEEVQKYCVLNPNYVLVTEK